MTALLVALGAAVGAPLRYAWAHALDARWPLGTLLVNVVGLGALRLLRGPVAVRRRRWALLGTGFCGGFTSFSAFAVQSVDRRPREAAPYVPATVVLAAGGLRRWASRSAR